MKVLNKHLSSESPERQYIRNKREFEIYEISKSRINIALYYQCSLFIMEDLSIKHKDVIIGVVSYEE